ncbi:MAG: hypothetical protein AAF743_02730 [Planctomycetota bacterium]
MLLQTNSYIVPKDKRTEHARLMRHFRDIMHRLGCLRFEIFEQTGPNWTRGDHRGDGGGRFVQMIAFRDRDHQRDVQAAEQSDPTAQRLIGEFCDLVNYPYQQQQGLFASGFYAHGLDGGIVDGKPHKVSPHDDPPLTIEQIEDSPEDDLADMR